MSAASAGPRTRALDGLLEATFGRAPGAYVEEPLPQHASTRTYARLRFGDDAAARAPYPATLMVMRLPADPLTSDEGANAEAPDELPFTAIARLLGARGLPVPVVHATDLRAGLVLLEDLGDVTFEDRLLRTKVEGWEALYGRAVDLLADMHRACADLPPDALPRTRFFDEKLLRWELDHFREWGIEAVHGPLPADERATMDALFDRLAADVAAGPTGFVHRDYQSRNLMWAPDAAGAPDRLAIIDFQDALTGPRVYDLVALLCDSYVAIPLALQRAMIARYAARAGLPEGELPAFEAEVWRQALQRKLKDAGRFVFIDRERKNPSFLQWFPQSLVYVGRALERTPGYEALAGILARRLPGFPDDCAVPPSTSAAGMR